MFKCLNPSILLFLFLISRCFADDKITVIDQDDTIQIDHNLSLSQVISLTLEKYPQQLLTVALKAQVDALQQRGDSWLASAPRISLRYQDDLIADDRGAREFEAKLALPLWNWGQREAGQAVAEQAHHTTKTQIIATHLEVAGWVRKTLWNITLEQMRYQQAKSIVDISEKLHNKIKRRVELGDLPRSDLLLAKSDYLQKLLLLVDAKANVTYTRRIYISLTQMRKMPANYKEEQSLLSKIMPNHPKLAAINALINTKQTELHWIKSADSGQTQLTLGGKSEKNSENEDDIESISVEIAIPFGGSAHLAPKVAQAHVELTKIFAQRMQLFRTLEKQHHKAKYDLEMSQTKLKIADELKQIAQEHLKISSLSFSVGEINLIDLLKIQTRSYHDIHHAQECQIMLKKNIALYNQSVGVIP